MTKIESDEAVAVHEAMIDKYCGDSDEFNEIDSIFRVMSDEVDGDADQT